MIKEHFFVREDKIPSSALDVPILLCTDHWRVIYKNKLAYLYKFPRLGASVERYICDVSEASKTLRSKRGKAVFLRLCWDIEGFKKAYAVRRSEEPDQVILVFSKSFSSVQEDIGEDFKDFIAELAQRMDFSKDTKESSRLLPQALFLLERRGFTSALETHRKVSGSEMSVENVSFVMERYYSRIFKRARGSCDAPAYRFCDDFAYSRLSYIDASELFATCFLLASSRLAFTGGGFLDVVASRRGSTALFEAALTPEKDVSQVIRDFNASAEMLILCRLAEAQGWKFEITPNIGAERVIFRLYAKVYTPAYVITSVASELSCEEAFARFMSFLVG